MRRVGIFATVGLTLAHGACTSSSKTVLATGGATGSGGADASSDAGGSGGASGSGGTALSYEGMVVSDGPSLYWRELTGLGSVGDVSPKRNDGNYSGCVEPSVASAGPTIRLCGGYLYGADIFDFADKAPFTFEAWIKPERVQLSEFARIAGKENPVPEPRQGWNLILIGWQQDGGTAALAFERWYVADASPTRTGVVLDNPSISSDSFTHVVVTYDSTTCRVYLNGVWAAEALSQASVPDTTSTFRVGADSLGGHTWIGEIDEVAVYEKALLPARIAAHYDRGRTEGY